MSKQKIELKHPPTGSVGVLAIRTLTNAFQKGESA